MYFSCFFFVKNQQKKIVLGWEFGILEVKIKDTNIHKKEKINGN